MGQAAESEMVVKQDLRVVAEVRRFVRLVTGQWGMDDFVPCLVASELVTNAIQYASASDDDVTCGWEGPTRVRCGWRSRTRPATSRTCWTSTRSARRAGACSSSTSSAAAGASARSPATSARSSSRSSTRHEDRWRGDPSRPPLRCHRPQSGARPSIRLRRKNPTQGRPGRPAGTPQRR